MREITFEEFSELIEKERKRAVDNMKLYGVSRSDWWFTQNETNLAPGDAIPCRYQHSDGDWDTDIECPISKRIYRRRKMPKNLRGVVKPEVQSLHHASDETCIHINTRTTVRCYAKVENKYYTCEHKAGSCPWKTKS